MVSNCLPLKYIIDTHGNVLNKLDYYAISKYCTKSEYEEYCKDHFISSLENPNMTLDCILNIMILRILIGMNVLLFVLIYLRQKLL